MLFAMQVSSIKAVEANQVELDLQSSSVVLIDAQSKNVLYEMNSFENFEPASITKIMTTYLGFENAGADETMVATANALESFDRNSSHIYLNYDEELTVQEGAYAIMLESANDVSNVMAEHVGGTLENFSQMMNEEAREAGAMATNFVNAHGLSDEGHVTTAYDMALITRHALQNDQFKEVFGTLKYEMAPTNEQKETRYFANDVELLRQGEYYYEDATGGKLGWTPDAGYTMVASAERDGLELIVVVLNAPTAQDRYEDAIKLFDYGFEYYKGHTIESEEIQSQSIQFKSGAWVSEDVEFTFEDDLYIILNKTVEDDAIRFEYIFKNEENADSVEAYVQIYQYSSLLGELPMKKTITAHDVSFGVTIMPYIAMTLDVISVLVFILLMGIVVVAFVYYRANKKVKT